MKPMPLFVSLNHLGLKRVDFDPESNLRILLNDQTRHGMQSADPARSGEPLTYYHRCGPLGDVFSAWRRPEVGGRLAIIGLGVGSMAAYAEPGQHLTFYEIDPVVAQIAADPRYFTYLSQCRGTCETVLGDGREALARAPDHHYDMIVLDAFSDDRIPPHLVCAEALELYLGKLADAGILVFHITNVRVELEPLLAGLAADAGLIGLARADLGLTDDERSMNKRPSHYVVLARTPRPVGGLTENPKWATLA